MIWIIGAGPMAIEYVKVLKKMAKDFKVIGRSESTAQAFSEKTGVNVISGGLDNYLDTKPDTPSEVIVAVDVDQLPIVTSLLLEYGVKKVLLEKPGAVFQKDYDEILDKIKSTSATVVLAYNRRFFASVQKLKQMVANDGGVTSFNFEFTEWSHVIQNLKKSPDTFATWLIGNSSHVIDLAFFLGGAPEKISCYKSGEGEISWHQAASRFSGAGLSKAGALFSYQANWNAPGRWAVEVLTKKNRYYLRPLEKLAIQKLGTVNVEQVDIDDSLDQEFKPGLYLQVEKFLNEDYQELCSFQEQAESFKNYLKMLNGNH